MASLFDFDDDESSGAEESPNKNKAVMFQGDEGSPAFTVATVLEKRDGSRRDTITRVMPTMSISDSDKYAIPTTAQKQQIDNHQQNERTELRATSSLLNDSSDSEHDGDDGGDLERPTYAHQHGVENADVVIFRTPSHDHQIEDASTTKSTIVRQNTAAMDESKHTNLLDAEVNEEDELESSPNMPRKSNRHSDTFVSVYEDIATQKRLSLDVQAKEQVSHAAAKGTQVKALVTTALQTVKEGFAARATSSNTGCDGVVGSWDVDKLSGKKRAFGIGVGSENDDGQRHRRKSMNIRAELILLQDAVEEKKEECDILKRDLEESQSQMQALQQENSIVLQSKAILESKLDLSKESCRVAEAKVLTARAEADYANNRVITLSSKLREAQSDAEKIRLDLDAERRKNIEAADATDRIESALQKIKDEKNDVMRVRDSLQSRREMQKEIDTMRKALGDIKELDRVRTEESRRIEAELREAHDALEKANAAAAATETTVASLRGAVEALQRENGSLRAQLTQNETPDHHHWSMDVDPGSHGVEVAVKEGQMDDVATPRPTRINHNINLMGAEDRSEQISNIPFKAIQGTPDSASRHLFSPSSKVFPTDEKENRRNMEDRENVCSLCMHAPRPNGVIKWCKCGNDGCEKWAHAPCLVNRKSVSTSVSHPGTPVPPLPVVLCGNIWDEN